MKKNNEIRVKTYIDNAGNKYNYCNPLFCEHPKEKKIIVKKILFENPNDSDTYTLAEVSYTDIAGTRDCLAFRWNITTGEKERNKNNNQLCIGYPYSPKKDPQWVILPNILNYLKKFIMK